jgi:hypothetical protein
MKKTIYTLAITTLLTATVLTGCQTSTKKEEVAKDKVADAREDMQDAAEELMVAKKEATAEEWKQFKAETNVRITENESQIAELKVKMKNTGNSIDAMYAKKIDELEQKNKEIKIKVASYKNDTSDDWESFKQEYNHDMDQLNQALNDMTVDNKK